MKQEMIKHVNGICYRVPEDMTPQAANNLVYHKQAEWVERRELSFAEKIGAAVSATKQKLNIKPRSGPDEVALAQNQAENTAKRTIPLTRRPPVLPIIDTGAADGEGFVIE